MQNSGRLSLEASADPWTKQLNFHVKAALHGLRLRALSSWTEERAGLRAEKGTLDLYAEVIARDGRLNGGVRPILKNVEVESAKPNLFDKLKAWVADKGLDLFSDDQGRTATTIPIKGHISDPEAQLWPTVFGVLRNAFVEGLTGGFSNLPPPTAEEKQNVSEQAGDALSGKKGPPKAQPRGK